MNLEKNEHTFSKSIRDKLIKFTETIEFNGKKNYIIGLLINSIFYTKIGELFFDEKTKTHEIIIKYARKEELSIDLTFYEIIELMEFNEIMKDNYYGDTEGADFIRYILDNAY